MQSLVARDVRIVVIERFVFFFAMNHIAHRGSCSAIGKMPIFNFKQKILSIWNTCGPLLIGVLSLEKYRETLRNTN